MLESFAKYPPPMWCQLPVPSSLSHDEALQYREMRAKESSFGKKWMNLFMFYSFFINSIASVILIVDLDIVNIKTFQSSFTHTLPSITSSLFFRLILSCWMYCCDCITEMRPILVFEPHLSLVPSSTWTQSESCSSGWYHTVRRCRLSCTICYYKMWWLRNISCTGVIKLREWFHSFNTIK